MDNSIFGQGIQSLIPKKSKLTTPTEETETKKEEENENEQALANRISQKLESTLSPLYQVESDLMVSAQKGIKEESKASQSIIFEKEKEEEEDEWFLKEKPISQKKTEKIFYLETDRIKPNPEQPRRFFPEESINELAESIKEYGILEPLVVYRVEKETDSGTRTEYYLISGERRLLAAKKIGLETVPAIIRIPKSQKEQLELTLIENIQREDLSPIAKAKAFHRLIEEFGLSQKEVGDRLGKSREVVANTLRLLQLPYEAQKALEEGKINEGHSRAILMINNPQKRLALLGEILTKNLSGREAEELAKKYLGLSGSSVASFNRRQDVFLTEEDLELKEKLENKLQTKVVIKKKGGKGEIDIHFYSEEELKRIIEKMGSN